MNETRAIILVFVRVHWFIIASRVKPSSLLPSLCFLQKHKKHCNTLGTLLVLTIKANCSQEPLYHGRFWTSHGIHEASTSGCAFAQNLSANIDDRVIAIEDLLHVSRFLFSRRGTKKTFFLEWRSGAIPGRPVEKFGRVIYTHPNLWNSFLCPFVEVFPEPIVWKQETSHQHFPISHSLIPVAHECSQIYCISNPLHLRYQKIRLRKTTKHGETPPARDAHT